jgi:hypothetical protein
VRKVLPIDVELILSRFDLLGRGDDSEKDIMVELIRALHLSFD